MHSFIKSVNGNQSQGQSKEGVIDITDIIRVQPACFQFDECVYVWKQKKQYLIKPTDLWIPIRIWLGSVRASNLIHDALFLSFKLVFSSYKN